MTDYTARYRNTTPVAVMIGVPLTIGYLGAFGMVADNHQPREQPAIVQPPKPLHREAKPDPIITGMIATESSGNPSARSKKGAIGLMQLMPSTARELGVNPHIAAENVKGGTLYLDRMVARYGNQTLGLVAYNMGPGATDRWLKKGGHWHKLPKETRDYVSRVNVNTAMAERQVAMK